jgi:hypothetical protein
MARRNGRTLGLGCEAVCVQTQVKDAIIVKAPNASEVIHHSFLLVT